MLRMGTLPHPRKATGAQITHPQHEKILTKNNETVLFEVDYRNGYSLNPLTRGSMRGQAWC
ncbi:unnamed protein product [Gongylonema pulchrum]|uniref:Transposase n=1 Tax=Gongylonema pulchrum TaxID=637853 RepID=A0A183E5I0_9BILA|nr:unnamed protein product [Gongylonema pulchrum]